MSENKLRRNFQKCGKVILSDFQAAVEHWASMSSIQIWYGSADVESQSTNENILKIPSFVVDDRLDEYPLDQG